MAPRWNSKHESTKPQSEINAHLVPRVVLVRDPRPVCHPLPPVLEREELGELLPAAAAEPALRAGPPDAVRPRPQVHLQPLAHARRDGVLGAPRATEAVAVHPETREGII